MIKPFLTIIFLFGTLFSFAFYVPQENSPHSKSGKMKETIHLIQELSVEEFELFSGKKMSQQDKKQYLKVRKKLQKGKSFSMIPQRDELTEGFQALPFFGSILTVGLVALVMVFTARDRNAMRWALNGISVLAIALSITLLITSLSGY